MENLTFWEDPAKITEVGVMEIINKEDITNGHGGPYPASDEFYDRIAWVQEQVPEIKEHFFFTAIDPQAGTIFSTEVIFRNNLFAVAQEAAAFVRTGMGPSSVLTNLQITFQGSPKPRLDYPGYEARHPAKPCPVGKAEPAWGPGF